MLRRLLALLRLDDGDPLWVNGVTLCGLAAVLIAFACVAIWGLRW